MKQQQQQQPSSGSSNNKQQEHQKCNTDQKPATIYTYKQILLNLQYNKCNSVATDKAPSKEVALFSFIFRSF